MKNLKKLTKTQFIYIVLVSSLIIVGVIGVILACACIATDNALSVVGIILMIFGFVSAWLSGSFAFSKYFDFNLSKFYKILLFLIILFVILFIIGMVLIYTKFAYVLGIVMVIAGGVSAAVLGVIFGIAAGIK